MKVGVVGLGEAGNLGDDLILIAMVQALQAVEGVDGIAFTGFGRRIDWRTIAAELSLRLVPQAVPVARDLPGSRRNETLFADCDAVLLGGGGLLQTSHHPYRPYHWLRYLPIRRPLVPAIAVGVGIGPLNEGAQAWLTLLGQPVDKAFLRDDVSVAVARDRLRWPSVDRCQDFVDQTFLAELGVSPDLRHDGARRGGKLGVAVRAWPGLDPMLLAKHVSRVAEEARASRVVFYVLEASKGGPDAAFTLATIRGLVSCAESRYAEIMMRSYTAPNLIQCVRDMASCDAGVSMKLHSSAVWAASHTLLYPIFYAPKTAAFFGVPYRGLELFERVLRPAEDGPSVPRAQDVVSSWLTRVIEVGQVSHRRTLTRRGRFGMQLLSTAASARLAMTSRAQRLSERSSQWSRCRARSL